MKLIACQKRTREGLRWYVRSHAGNLTLWSNLRFYTYSDARELIRFLESTPGPTFDKWRNRHTR